MRMACVRLGQLIMYIRLSTPPVAHLLGIHIATIVLPTQPAFFIFFFLLSHRHMIKNHAIAHLCERFRV